MKTTFLGSKNLKKGFTLVETIVYLVILGLMFAVVVNILLNMSKAYGVLNVHRNLNSSAITSLERIVREIRQGESVDSANSILGVSPGKLVLNSLDDEGNPSTIEFSTLSDGLLIKEGGVTLGPLTLGSTTVDSLIFRSISTPVSQAVKIQMTLTSSHGVDSKTETFYSTAILRGSYSQ